MGLLLAAMMLGGNVMAFASAGEEGGGPARAANFQLSVTPGNATRAVNASTSVKSATYPFQIKNVGDTSLPYCDLQLYPWTFDDRWSYNFVPSLPVEIEAGKILTVLLVIYPPADAEAKRYSFQIDGKGSTPVGNSISVNLDVLQYGDVEVSASPPQTAKPGETLEFIFSIRNTGNGKDRFLIESIFADSALQTRIKDGSNRTGVVGYKGMANKTVVVVLSEKSAATYGAEGLEVGLEVSSEFDPRQDDLNLTHVGVAQTYDFTMYAYPQKASIPPGVESAFEVAVQNRGNGADIIELNLSTGFDDGGWKLYFEPRRLQVSAWGAGTAKLKATAPPMTPAGGRYAITITGRSSGPPGSPVERNATINITIATVRSLVAPAQNFTAGPLRPGSTALFGLNITNAGNVEELVDLTLEAMPPNWTGGINCPAEFRLRPGATRSFELAIQPARNRADAPAGTYRFGLVAANADRSSTISFIFELAIPFYYDWEMTTGSPTSIRLMPGANNIANFTLGFANTGDDADDIGLALSGYGYSWARLEESEFTLPIGGTREIRLTVEVPNAAEVGRTYSVAVGAASRHRPDLVRWLTFTIEVVWVDLEVVESSVRFEPKDGEAGTPVRVFATIQNLGSVEERFVEVGFFGEEGGLIGRRVIDRLAPRNGWAVVETSWTLVYGWNGITVKVDPNSIVAEMDEKNNEDTGFALGYRSDLVVECEPVFIRHGYETSRVNKDDRLIVQVNVRNDGLYSHDLANVTVRLTDQLTGEVQNATITLLKARESATLNFNWTVHRTGKHTFTAKVDPDHKIKEKTLENNEQSATLKVLVVYVNDPRPWQYILPAILLAGIFMVALSMMRNWRS